MMAFAPLAILLALFGISILLNLIGFVFKTIDRLLGLIFKILKLLTKPLTNINKKPEAEPQIQNEPLESVS